MLNGFLFPSPIPIRLKSPQAHRQGDSSATPEANPPNEESLLIDNILLPTARLSKDLLEESETRPPETAHSREEAVLLSYVKNRQKHRALSVLDGASIGISTGVVAGLASIPIAFALNKTGVLNHYPHALKEGNFFQFLMYHLLFQGFEEVAKADNTLKSKLLTILPSVLKTMGFGVLSGVFLSMYLTKHQVKLAKHIANEWHKLSEDDENHQTSTGQTPANSKNANDENDHPLPEKSLTYPEWKHYAENWKHHAVEAFKFNFVFSTVMLGAQILGLVMALGVAKREGLLIKKYFDAMAKRFEDKDSVLHFMNNWQGGLVGWIKAKSNLPNSKAIHDSFQKEWPTFALTCLTARFSLLNVARLSMLSVLTAKFWGDKNIKHIKDLESDVQNTNEDRPKTNLKVNEGR
jgi:hypothetical protein